MRTAVAAIRETGRNAKGVTLMNVDDGDRLVAMAKIDAEEPVAGAETPPPPAEGGEAVPPPTDGTPQ